METTSLDPETLEEMKATGRDFYLLFTANWCGFCASLKRELEESPSDFQLFELDISDEKNRAWEEYEIDVVPTAIFFKGGEEFSRKATSFRSLRIQEIRALSGAAAPVPE